MTTDPRPTPPPELVEERWNKPQVGGDFAQELAAFFAHWGADQQLEACCEYIGGEGKWFANPPYRLAELRAAMRPQPEPTLKEQALSLVPEPGGIPMKRTYSPDELRTIRAALEQLPDGPAVTPPAAAPDRPLWDAMSSAYDDAVDMGQGCRHGVAAELRVVADCLEEHRAMVGLTAADWLRAEAERAEAGEP